MKIETIFWMLIGNYILYAIVLFALLKHSYGHRLEFSWERTFWTRSKTGIELWFWNESHDYGKRIFCLTFKKIDTDKDYKRLREARHVQK